MIKIDIIGCGHIGERHAHIICHLPDIALPGALCDTDTSKARQLSEKYGDIPVYADYRRMLEESDADLVSICTPHALHKQMTLDAIAAGKHVLCEKPMALTSDDCEEMNKAAEAKGVKLFVVKQNRYNVPIVLTKEAMDSGKLGRIFMVQCDVLWNRYEGYYSESDWRGAIATEGGALFTQASHFIDLLVWWFGDVTGAETFMDTKNHQIEIEDCGSSVLKFDSGVIGSLTWTTCVYNKNYQGSITVIGEYGTIKIGGQYLNKIEYWDVRAYPLPENIDFNDKPNSYGKYQGTSSNHDKVIKDVVAALGRSGKSPVEGVEGIRSIKAIELIYANARK